MCIQHKSCTATVHMCQISSPFICIPRSASAVLCHAVCYWVCSKTEMLAKSNKFECETCGSHQEAQRRIKIRAAPSCLILHLKRFKFIEHLRR